MNLIKVNLEKCIKCGLCTNVCPTKVIKMGKNCPEEDTSETCISCGHCVAICPKEAIDNINTPFSKQIKLESFPVIDKYKAEKFLKSRRSTRCYKNIQVDKNKLLELINITRFAPTASNGQNISYIVINNKKKLEEATKIIIDWMENQLDNPMHWSFPSHVRAYREKKIDKVLRDAPALILAIAPRGFKNGRENSISQLSYLELFATTLGLASCFAGLFEMCAFSSYEPLLKHLNIPNDKVITGAVMVGYPKYTYKRLVDRNELNIKIIE
ncbi:nitroreductase family protein [Clostridium thermobutyricum]|uniref:nitroreductase family protein n=1 Tax=Clostridium thermobutyricum TaxID=29372 RepID=UPI0029432CD2|nr:nitroreductase family protein [Clostridium thermobutyricum]